MEAETMKAWQYSSVTGKLEDALTLNESVPVPKPASLAKDQLLIQVVSAAINPVDYKIPEFGAVGKLMIPRPATPGLDFCGRVVAKHPSNTAFAEGQLVFGGFPSSVQKGALAQYTVVPSSCCAVVPQGISPDEAAAVGTAATSAFQSLMPGTLKPGMKVFINGGSGGVGTWAIQLAKTMGAEVVTTCSTNNVEVCRSLGADEVIDYRKEDVVSNLKKRGPVFDISVDNVGNNPELYNACAGFIKSGGTFVQVGVGSAMSLKSVASIMRRQLWPSCLRGRKFHFVNMKNPTEYFDRIGGWMSEGKVKAVINSKHAFEDVPEAFRRLRGGHGPGKLVINVADQTI